MRKENWHDHLASFLDSDSEHRSKVLALLEKGHSAHSQEVRNIIRKSAAGAYATGTSKKSIASPELAPFIHSQVKQAKSSTLLTLFNSQVRDEDPDITTDTPREERIVEREKRKQEAKDLQQQFKAEQASKKRKKEETEEEKPAPRRSPRSTPRSLTRTTPLGGVPGSSNAAS